MLALQRKSSIFSVDLSENGVSLHQRQMYEKVLILRMCHA